VAITSYTRDAAKGEWWYYNGSTWTQIGGSITSASAALALKSADQLKFVPASNWNGAAPSLTVTLIDSSATVTAGATLDVSSAGGTTAYSATSVVLGHSVTAVNDAPVSSGSTTLASVAEDIASASNTGALISSLINTTALYSDATDTVSAGSSATTLAGIAITGNAATTGGTWEYSTNGTTWYSIATSVSDTQALVLAAGSYLHFQPTANWNGTPGALTARTSDGTGFVASSSYTDYKSVSVNGTTTGWSATTISIGTTVTAANDAPTKTATPATLTAINEDQATSVSNAAVLNAGATVSTLFANSFSDATDSVSSGSSANSLAGVLVVGNTADSGTQGAWQYLSGGNWTAVGTVSTSNGLYVASTDSLRFVPVANFNGAPTGLTVRLADSSTDLLSTGTRSIDVSDDSAKSGVTTRYSNSTNAITLTTSVTAINDAPVLDAAQSPTLTTIAEDVADGSNTGTTIATMVVDASITDVDTTAVEAAYLTAVDNAHGIWQYKLGAGSWTAVNFTDNAGKGLLLDATDSLRFVPAGNWNGTASVTFGAWDKTAGGSAGTYAVISTVGGTSAFSSATDTATITVTAVNDAPVAVADTGAVSEDATLTKTNLTGVVQGTGTDTDIDNTTDSLVVSGAVAGTGSVTQNVGVGTSVAGTYGHLTLAADGSYSYVADTANALATGVTANDVFTYTVKDSAGLVSNTATLTITVTGTDDAPVAVADAGAVNEDATLTTTNLTGVIQGAGTDTDVDNTSASLVVSGAVAGTGSVTQGAGIATSLAGTYGHLTLQTDGSYSYVADQAAADALATGATATDVFTYTVKDSGNLVSNTATLTITVTGTDDAPVAVADAGAVNEDATLTTTNLTGVIQGAGTDTDVDNTSASLVVSGAVAGTGSVTQGAGIATSLAGTYGHLTLAADGSYSYVADQAASVRWP